MAALKLKTVGRYDEIRDDIATFADHIGLDVIRADIVDCGWRRVMWALYKRARFDRECDDDHPLFVDGRRKRILPFVREDHYTTLNDSGVNGDHISSALRYIAKELGLTK